MIFKAQRLAQLLRELPEVEVDQESRVWLEILELVHHFVRKGLRQEGARPDEVDDVQSTFLLGLCTARDGIAEGLREIPPGKLASYIRVSSLRILMRLREGRSKQAARIMLPDIIQEVGRELEPDELHRALLVLASLDLETRFLMRGLMLGFSIDEITEAIGGRGTRMRLYRKRKEAIAAMLKAIRET